MKKISKISEGVSYVTDKMPQNFLHIALICSAFPEAKIVHTRRQPAATCWSNFKEYFPNGINYSFNLDDIIHRGAQATKSTKQGSGHVQIPSLDGYASKNKYVKESVHHSQNSYL